MEASTLLWFLSVSLASCLLYKLFASTKTSSSKARRRAPGPAPLPLVGNILELRGEPHHALARLAGTHGPVMSLRLGTTDAIVVSSAAAARDVLQRYDHVLAARSVSDAGRALGNHEHSVIWLPSTSPLWKRLRAVCTNHLFSARALDATRAAREEGMRQLVACVGRHGETVDVGRAVFSCVLNLVSRALFSEDVVADLSSDRAQELEMLVRDAVEEVTKPNLSDLFPVLARLDLQGRRRRNAEFVGRFYDFFDPIIARRIEARGSGEKIDDDDFLDVLLQLHSTDQLSLQTIKSFLLTTNLAHAGSLCRWNGHERDHGGVDDGRAAPAPGRDVQGPRGAAGGAGLQAAPGRVGHRQAALSPRRGDGEHEAPPAEPDADAAPGHGRRRGGGRLRGARRHQGDHKPMDDPARPGVVGGARGVRAGAVRGRERRGLPWEGPARVHAVRGRAEGVPGLAHGDEGGDAAPGLHPPRVRVEAARGDAAGRRGRQGPVWHVPQHGHAAQGRARAVTPVTHMQVPQHLM